MSNVNNPVVLTGSIGRGRMLAMAAMAALGSAGISVMQVLRPSDDSYLRPQRRRSKADGIAMRQLINLRKAGFGPGVKRKLHRIGKAESVTARNQRAALGRSRVVGKAARAKQARLEAHSFHRLEARIAASLS